MRFGKIHVTMAAIGVAALAFTIPASSQTLVTSSGALGATDTIGWGQLGPTFTQLTTAQNWTSVGGATGQVGIDLSTIGTTNMERRDQGNGWNGNFLPGDQLLWNQDTTTGNSSIGLLFNTPVAGVGAQIMADPFGAFTGNITAFLVGGGTESFSEAGTANPNADGSAIFIGVLDPTADINFVTFGTTDVNGGNTIALDTVFITSNSGPGGTPEPGSAAMLAAMAGSGIAVLRRKRRTV